MIKEIEKLNILEVTGLPVNIAREMALEVLRAKGESKNEKTNN